MQDLGQPPKLMFYCQQVLGMGHLVRSTEILRALDGFCVQFVHGGEPIAMDLPRFVETIQLPPIRTDQDFKQIRALDDRLDIDTTRSLRRKRLISAFDTFAPDILLIELFPFGRKQFAYELLPLLARNRLAERPARVVCSIRDILVKKSDPIRHEARVCEVVNRYFDHVMIHSDPDYQRIDETFSRTEELTARLSYTGYVVQPLANGPPRLWQRPGRRGEKLFVASAGGGRVGHELLAAAIDASAVLKSIVPHTLLVFTGPYMEEHTFNELEKRAAGQPQIRLDRFASNFVDLLSKADLSISMAGYNTCMNILQSGVRALVLPFTGGGNDEQSIRARQLAKLGVLQPLSDGDLEPVRFARLMRTLLERPHQPDAKTLQTNGAVTAARLLRAECDAPRLQRRIASPSLLSSALERRLTNTLTRIAAEGKTVDIFLRDDDVDKAEDSLRRLFDTVFAYGVPINLEVIPANLTDECILLLKVFKGFDRELIEVHQHGWRHVNHEATGRKCEFGPSRRYAEQRHNILAGQRLLKTTFGKRFFPSFTPPWNRCNGTTFQVIDELGFQVLSKDRGDCPTTGYRFREISTTIDIFHWKGGATLKPADTILTALIEQLDNVDPIGLLLHHKVMDEKAFSLVDDLIRRLVKFDCVHFKTLRTLAESDAVADAANAGVA